MVRPRATVGMETLRQLREGMADMHLPEFQRSLVWSAEQVLACMDSIERKYPIGQLLIWEVYVKGAGSRRILIDGQQRLTALTGRRPSESADTFKVYRHIDDKAWTLTPSDRTIWLWDNPTCKGFFERIDAWGGLDDDDLADALKMIDQIIYSWIPTYTFEGHPVEEVMEAFRRVNLAGTPIDIDEMGRLLAQETGHAD